MAQFDNVNYTHYSSDLGRAIVPDAATFDAYKLGNVLFIESLLKDDLIKEREAGGIDDACCMMIEEDYCASKAESGADDVQTSESIGGYSYSVSAKASEIAIEKNALSKDEKKYKWLSLFCEVTNGRR